MYHNSSDHNCSVFHRRGLVGDLLIHNIYKFFVLIPVADLKKRHRGRKVKAGSGKKSSVRVRVAEVLALRLAAGVPGVCVCLKSLERGAAHFTRAPLELSGRELFQAQ